jgi:hypothetical protein
MKFKLEGNDDDWEVQPMDWDLFFGLYPSPLCFLNHNVSRDGSSLILRWNLLCWVRLIKLASISGLMEFADADWWDHAQKTEYRIVLQTIW